MKHSIFTLFVLFTFGLVSCRKDKVYPDIQQYDQSQIANYIQVHGLNQMIRDTSGGDTTGIYYQILTPPPAGALPLSYSNYVSIVFTAQTLDGQFVQADTLNNNHVYDFLGHLQNHRFIAYGLEIALLNDLKYNGGRIRVLVPSKLAYGVDGYGTGSVNTTDTHIGGNESLDYYVNVIYNQPAYDDLVIRNYLAAQNLTGYTKTTDGAYYKITTPPTTSTDPITINSTVTATYTGTLLDGIIFDSFTTTGGTPLNVIDQTAGVQECLQFVQTGASISMILPSALQYGNAGVSGKVSPISCVRYEYQIVSVTP